jgi:hypothetical protein
MINTLHVLSIGFEDTSTVVRDVLMLRSRCRLYVATSTWDLSVVLGSEEVDVAILHNTFPLRQLRVFEAYIRSRWPCARILLVNEPEEKLDYGMYDERITPGASPESLLAAIERLGACARRARQPIASTAYMIGVPRENGRNRPHNARAGRRR